MSQPRTGRSALEPSWDPRSHLVLARLSAVVPDGDKVGVEVMADEIAVVQLAGEVAVPQRTRRPV